MKSVNLILVLTFLFFNSTSQAQKIVSDSLINEVIQSIYPNKSHLKLKIEELPSIIYVKSYWENEMDKTFILRIKGFDSSLIEAQIKEREIINVDSITKRPVNLFDTSWNDRKNVEYILFSRDRNMVIIKEMRYCGEDCGSDMITLYKRNKRGDWIFEKTIFGGIY